MSHPAPLTVVEGCNSETPSSTLSSSPRARRESAAAALATIMSSLRRPAGVINALDNNPQDRSLLQQQSPQRKCADMEDAGGSSSQSVPQSIANSQESHITSSSAHAITPPASDDSSLTDGAAGGRGISCGHEVSDKNDHLFHLSTIAAAQDRIMLDTTAGTRKRMADGEVKALVGNTSPIKCHSRNVSTVSVASTTGSTIGELSAELKTRLSYAMVKVNLGWQTRSLEEVESLASQAVSPASSTSTVHCRHGSSASPHLALTTASSQVHFVDDSVIHRLKSDSPPNLLSNKPTLAPPATIQPSSSMPAPRSNPRRNSSPRYTPTMLSHSHSASPHTPGQPMQLDTQHSLSQPTRIADPILFPPHHQYVREQDAIESLLFMSSPNNSANLRHTFSPSASPGPHVGSIRSSAGRHVLPSGPRKGLPTRRPSLVHKRTGFEKSPGIQHPSDSAMDLDAPHHAYNSPNRATPKRRVKGTSNHLRGALSLPSGLGAGHSGARRVLRDEDIERMLDRAGAETADSSDDEEIQIPRPRNSMAGVMGVRG